jgi:AraC-like DNA-binding protein
MHSHAAVEIVFHFSGSGATNCSDGGRLDFAPGDVIVYPPGLAHDQRMDGAGMDHCLQVEPLEPYLKRRMGAPFKLSGLRSQTALSELTDLESWFDEEPKEARDLRASALLATLLHERDALTSGRRDQVPAAAMEARRIAMSELASPPSGTEIAGRLGVSPDYLRHLALKHFGRGLKEISLEARTARAMKLLANSPMRLKEIAAETGFANAKALCSAFKARLGTSPGQFRARSSGVDEPSAGS